jgi:uncharacterized protein (DUF488 family)
MTIYTIGHSTRTIEEFIGLLQANHIKQLIDIRTIPRSRYNPQYEQDNLATSLREAGIKYLYLKELGGLRPKAKHSDNEGWRNQSFRNYADYMQTDGFSEGIDRLLHLAAKTPTAIMCAEAVPWRCHRSLVGDALLTRQIPVMDIIDKTSVKEHHLTPFAVVHGNKITYPSQKT